ncbi:unnamed protein product [Leuciscus chuanchicus]
MAAPQPKRFIKNKRSRILSARIQPAEPNLNESLPTASEDQSKAPADSNLSEKSPRHSLQCELQARLRFINLIFDRPDLFNRNLGKN